MLEDVSPVSPVGVLPKPGFMVFSVGKSSPFMALIHVSELLLFAQSYGKLMKIALSFLR